MNENKIWHEDIEDISIEKDKIKNFYYPIYPGETKNFREQIAIKIVNFIREINKKNNSFSDEITAGMFGLINEIVNIYYTLRLNSKLKQNNFVIIPNDKSRLLKDLINDNKPKYPKVLNQLIHGKERVKKRFFIPRIIRNILTEKYIIKNYVKLPNFEENIISISIDPFLELHAKNESKNVYYIRINEWFKNLNKPYGNENDLSYIVDGLLEIISLEYTQNNQPLSNNLKKYFEDFINLYLKKLSIYKKSILETNIGLPKILWTPSGGGIFANIFRQVCKSSGTLVVGHSHGSGTGFFSDYGRTLSILEYQSCTDFYVYTKKSVKEYIKYARKDLIVDGKLPNIKNINNNTVWPYDKVNKLDNIISFKKIRNKYILYIPSIFIYDNYYDGNLIDAHTTYDWMLKISNFLLKNNFNFKIKLHPKNPAPKKFIHYYKKNISNYNLARSINNSSLIITDQPSSTSFSASVISSKPIIFIDFNVQNFTNYSWKLINDRCSVIKGENTKSGLQIDWNDLKKNILNPKKVFTKDFQFTYFENVNK